MQQHHVALAAVRLFHYALDDLRRARPPPVIRIDLHPHAVVAKLTGQHQRMHLVGRFGFDVFGVGWPEQQSAFADETFQQPFGRIQFQRDAPVADIRDVGMRVGVIADLVALGIDALDQVGATLGVLADQKERCRHVFAFEDVENLWGPHRVGTIVESQRDHVVRIVAPAIDHIAARRFLDLIVGDEADVGVVVQVPYPVLRRACNL